jgi:hypothetical protein
LLANGHKLSRLAFRKGYAILCAGSDFMNSELHNKYSWVWFCALMVAGSSLVGCDDEYHHKKKTSPPSSHPSSLPTMPNHCTQVSQGFHNNRTMTVFPVKDNFLGVWLDYSTDSKYSTKSEIAMIEWDLTRQSGVFQRTPFAQGTMDLEDSASNFAKVGSQLLTISGNQYALTSLDGSASTSIFQGPKYLSVTAQAVDDTNVLLFGKEENESITIRRLNVSKQEFYEPNTFPTIELSADGLTGLSNMFGHTAKLILLPNENLMAIWVDARESSASRLLQGMLLDKEGAIVQGPTDLTKLQTSVLFSPDVAVLDESHLILSYSGTFDNFVRTMVVPFNLEEHIPSEGTVVNSNRSVPALLPSILPAEKGKALVVWNSFGTGLIGRKISVSGTKITIPSKEIDIVEGCSRKVTENPVLLPTKGGAVVFWKEDGWQGNSRLMAHPIDGL